MNAVILNAAIKATPLLILAGVATALLRRSSADLRHKIWLTAFFGALALMIPARVPESAQIPVTFTFVSDAVASSTSRAFPWATIWAAGAVILLLRFIVGIYHLGRLTRSAQPTDRPDVRISSAIRSPLTWGLIHPTILLPAYAADWTPVKLGIALDHERAHIDRGDWLWQSIAQLVTAIVWFHPLVWFAAARLRQEAEHAVDDVVVASGAGAVRYAEQLVEVAKHVQGSSLISAVAMVRRPSLTTRVTAILDATRTRAKAGFGSRVAIAITALCLVPLLAAFQEKSTRSVAPAIAKLANSMSMGDSTAGRGVRAGGDATANSFDAFKEQQTRPTRALETSRQSDRGAPPPATPQQTPAPDPESPQVPDRPGAGVTEPIVVYKSEPHYTDEARLLKIQGQVLLNMLVDEFGVPGNLTVVKSVGGGLDEEAILAVEQWRFKPGTKDGVPVPEQVTIAINFTLR